MQLEELPRRRPLTPSDHLRDIIEEAALTQQQFADALGIARRPNTALRLGSVLKTSAELWLRLQNQLELWDAVHSPSAKAIARLRPLKRRLNAA